MVLQAFMKYCTEKKEYTQKLAKVIFLSGLYPKFWFSHIHKEVIVIARFLFVLNDVGAVYTRYAFQRCLRASSWYIVVCSHVV